MDRAWYGRLPDMTRLRRWLLALGLGVGVVLIPVVGFAGTDTDPDTDLTPVGPDAQQVDSALFNLSPFIVSSILGTLIPLVTGLLTKITTPAWVKAVITAALSAVAGLINVSLVDNGGAVVSQSAVVSAVLTFVVAVTTYRGFWKPLSVTSSPVTHVNNDGNLVTEPGKLATVGVK